MAHQWDRGVLNASSWHGLESVEALPDAETMIRRGLATGAWPLDVKTEEMWTAGGQKVPGKAVVAGYQDGSSRALGAVGNAYKPLSPSEWRATVEAAVKAGAKPSGAFSLYGGARIVATFEIPGGNGGSGLANNLVIADSFDSSTGHLIGSTTIRVVCANTMGMFLRENGHANVRHTASVDDAAKALRGAMEEHIQRGEKIKILYRQAKDASLTDFDRATVARFLEALYPTPDEKTRTDKPGVAKQMIAAQDEFFSAMKRPENNEGQTVASLWNAATFLVDRKADGQPRTVRGDKDGSGRLASMLFGSRGKDVQQVQELVEELLSNGQTRERTVIVPTPAAPPMPAAGSINLDDYL